MIPFMMQIKKHKRNISILCLVFFTVGSDIAMSANKTRKSVSGKQTSSRASKSSNKSAASARTQTKSVNTNIASAGIATNIATSISEENDINDDNCELKYNLCMNNICNDPTIGKCLCYEDKYTNTINQTFVNINGNNVRKGFELLEFAKKQCVYILDKCMNVRRSITEKYSNLMQRDCLMVSEVEVAKDKGLSGEIKELKSCIRDYCTAYNMDMENFSMPEYGLCFDPVVANFQIDANCSSVIAKSKTPVGLRDLFLNEMAKLREESCQIMNGEMSSDRQKCYINISYGPNKEQIAASKKIAVGEYFYCNGREFNTDLGLSEEFERQKKHEKLQLAAKGLRATGNVVGVVVGESVVAEIVNAAIDIGTLAAQTAVDAKMIQKGYMSKAEGAQNIVNNLNSIGLSSIILSVALRDKKEENNLKMKEKAAAEANKKEQETKDEKVSEISDGLNKENIDNSGKKEAPQNGMSLSKTLNVVSSAIDVAGGVTGYVMQSKIDNIIIENEKKGIIDYVTFENRDLGLGSVNKTAGARGNCFINGEWLATENEIILLQWKL